MAEVAAKTKKPEPQISNDGLRMIELVEVKDDDGGSVLKSADRPTTLEEQAGHFADEVAAAAVGIVSLAVATDVKVSGNTITITLKSADDVAKEEAKAEKDAA